MNTEMEADFADVSDAFAHDEDREAMGVYELGYHLLPTLTEDAVEGEAAKVLEVLKKHNVEIIGERTPAKIRLAYAIETKVDGAKRAFDSAYFGWVAFSASTAVPAEIESALKTNEQVLRHIVIKTTRDTVAATLADPTLDVGAEEEATDEEDGETEDAGVSDKELDEALDNIEAKEEV